MNTIAPEIEARLRKNIREMLNAGMDTGKIKSLLSLEQSFGKYDGCTPQAVLEIANAECAALNAQIRAENREIRNAMIDSLRRDFPNMSQYFRK